MRNYRLEYCLIFLLTILGMLCISVAAQASTSLPEFWGGINPATVYTKQNAMKIFQQCSSQASNPGDYQNCLVDTMQTQHATPQAIAFLKYATGWITEYKVYNKLIVVHAFTPAADHDDAYFIMNNYGDIVNVDDPTFLNAIDIRSDSHYHDIIQHFPSAALFPGNHQGFPEYTVSDQNSPRFVFTYSVLNGCHACEVAATAKIAFDFDNSGQLIGVSLLSLTPVPATTSPASASISSGG